MDIAYFTYSVGVSELPPIVVPVVERPRASLNYVARPRPQLPFIGVTSTESAVPPSSNVTTTAAGEQCLILGFLLISTAYALRVNST
jgi:hypothetical protein